MTAVAWTGPGIELFIDSPGREATIRGQLGVRTVPELRAQLQRILAAGDGDLVLHLNDAEVADATGLGVLVGLHQRARRQNRRLVIAEASERLERLMRITRLHLVLARVDGLHVAGPPQLHAGVGLSGMSSVPGQPR
ncbi:STAS domain-containing protein [Ornithinimicrobium faecis]|uniref:STAS domain-containing protein n=1 Tax=Ornithinimicrobium faecis TaxID=2934158 RepID=A0ABY4YSJ6_9MICO|nr:MULTISPECIES: STAS domain-containing protein [unclassified Ornithinimicrobium]USQ79338.1 STAS domain-containing protein [Ornithinimicrobium sp. HY1793]